MNYNRIILGGHLTRDPELRTTPGGVTVCKFALGTNRKRGEKESVCFVDLVAFGRTAEVMSEYLRKGDPVLVEGRLSQSRWEDDQGTKRSKHEVVVESFEFVGGASGDKAATQTGDVPF